MTRAEIISTCVQLVNNRRTGEGRTTVDRFLSQLEYFAMQVEDCIQRNDLPALASWFGPAGDDYLRRATRGGGNENFAAKNFLMQSVIKPELENFKDGHIRPLLESRRPSNLLGPWEEAHRQIVRTFQEAIEDEIEAEGALRCFNKWSADVMNCMSRDDIENMMRCFGPKGREFLEEIPAVAASRDPRMPGCLDKVVVLIQSFVRDHLNRSF